MLKSESAYSNSDYSKIEYGMRARPGGTSAQLPERRGCGRVHLGSPRSYTPKGKVCQSS
jgi:hypothetical protein